MGNHGTIMNTFTSGYIGPQSNFSTTDMGGLVGTNYGTIGRSGSSARVEHGSGGGGLVYDNQGTILQSYATGTVYAVASRGSSGGLVHNNSGTISEAFATGAVYATRRGTVCVSCTGLGSDVYWNTESTPQTENGGNLPTSNGLTTAQMSDPKSFVGWNFGSDGAWAMPAGATHPVLRWQVEH
jgi:hypothetical protein